MTFWEAIEQMKAGKKITTNKCDDHYLFMKNDKIYSSGLDEWDFRYTIECVEIAVWCLFATNWRVFE